MRLLRRSCFILVISFGFLTVTHAAAAEKPAAKVDLNTADADSLSQIPGVSNAMAEKIVANRPYASVNELAKAGIKNVGLMTKIADWVTQPFDKTKANQAASSGDWGDNQGRR